MTSADYYATITLSLIHFMSILEFFVLKLLNLEYVRMDLETGEVHAPYSQIYEFLFAYKIFQIRIEKVEGTEDARFRFYLFGIEFPLFFRYDYLSKTGLNYDCVGHTGPFTFAFNMYRIKQLW